MLHVDCFRYVLLFICLNRPGNYLVIAKDYLMRLEGLCW